MSAFLYDQVVVIGVKAADFAVPITMVQEIVQVPAITAVPRTQADVQGIINLRGQVVPVLDLSSRLGFSATEHTRQTRVVVVQRATGSIGLLVDRVSEVLRVNPRDVAPPTDVLAQDVTAVAGVAKLEDRLVLLLDLDRALA
jgi:purine-binding chemotaxis protein CheW